MAYNNGAKKTYQSKNNNNNRGDNGNRRPRTESAPKFPKKETFTFPIIDSFTVKDRQGTVEIDKSVVLDSLQQLNDNGIFKVLTQNVSIANSILHNDPEKRGNATVGYIDEVDTLKCTIDVTIFGSSVDSIKAIASNLTIVPKVIANRGEFRCFNGFNLIPSTLNGVG